MHLLIKIMADFVFVIVIVWAFVVMVTLPQKVRWEYIIRGMIAGVVSEIVARIAEHLYHHAPPFVAQHVQPLAWHINNTNSFPSDHALLVFAAVFVAWASTRNPKIGWPLLILAIIVGVGRVMAHVHWPIDIVTSVIIAGVVTAIVYNIPYKGRRPLGWFNEQSTE
jgi:undecaprenyl-diphosphatase